MDKLQLALLICWAEDADLLGIQGRKRMQKVIYFLQQCGCPIEADFTLHHYGPYSREVANITDVMVAEGLLVERGGGGEQYDYRLGRHTREMIESVRSSCGESVRTFENFRDQAIELLRQQIWPLELGSTILYFARTQPGNPDWNLALQEACKYKRADPAQEASQASVALARRFFPKFT